MPDVPVVLAMVPVHRGARLAAALRPQFDVVWLDRDADLRSAPGVHPAAVVVDPLLLAGPAEWSEQALTELARTVPVVFYTDLTIEAMHRVFDLRRIPGARLVLAGIEDGPAALRRAVTSAESLTHRVRAAEALGATCDMPPSVADALRRLLATPGGELTVQHLAAAAGLTPRTLERRLAANGAQSAARLIRTARALLARELLATSTLTAAEIAREVGYAKLDSLRALTRWSFGASPSSLRTPSAGTGGTPRRTAGGG